MLKPIYIFIKLKTTEERKGGGYLNCKYYSLTNMAVETTWKTLDHPQLLVSSVSPETLLQ